MKTKEVKRSHKESQSGSCLLGGGSQSRKYVAHDFYHGFTCDGHAVDLFDHQSRLLAPNLTNSFLSWNYQYVFFCFNAVSCSELLVGDLLQTCGARVSWTDL